MDESASSPWANFALWLSCLRRLVRRLPCRFHRTLRSSEQTTRERGQDDRRSRGTAAWRAHFDKDVFLTERARSVFIANTKALDPAFRG